MKRSPVTVKVIAKPPLHRLIILQLFTTVLVAGLASIWGLTAASSAALGALVVTAGNTYFGWRAFRYNGTRYANKVLGSFYKAEIGKFALMAILMAIVFKFIEPLHTVALLIGFVITLLVGTIGAAVLLQSKNSTHYSHSKR